MNLIEISLMLEDIAEIMFITSSDFWKFNKKVEWYKTRIWIKTLLERLKKFLEAIEEENLSEFTYIGNDMPCICEIKQADGVVVVSCPKDT